MTSALDAAGERRGAFTIRREPRLGEELWLAETPAGLRVRVVPTTRFREVAAVITFGYGSTDLGFVENGTAHRSPEGVAHYLEHKLFEDEELKVFDRFARRGASVNAMTGFARTTYYFSATSRFEENLADLLHLVGRAHVTPENVEKERGIIAQEIRMYEDSPDYRGFFDLLGCLYEEHPVRHPVGGTVESIQHVTAEHLLDCWRAFYRAGNAALAAAGPVDPEAVLRLAEACTLPAGAAPKSLWPRDDGPVRRGRAERRMQVARPRVLLGFKDPPLGDDGPAGAEPRLRRELVTRLFLDRLFGASSDVREDLRCRGLVDDSLQATHLSEPSFGCTIVSCKSDRPEATLAALQEAMTRPPAGDLDERHLERVRRKFLGQYVRSFESNRSVAFQFAQEALDQVPPFRALERIASVEAAEVEARRREHCREDRMAAAVVLPEAGG